MNADEIQRRPWERLKVDWKAGCLETCTSGLGLGARCDSSPYITTKNSIVMQQQQELRTNLEHYETRQVERSYLSHDTGMMMRCDRQDLMEISRFDMCRYLPTCTRTRGFHRH